MAQAKPKADVPIQALLRENRRFPPPKAFVKNALVNKASVYAQAQKNSFPGVDADVLDEKGNPARSGYLVIKKPYPAMLRGIWGDPDRYIKQYWSKYDNIYFTGDGAKRDEDGYFWLLGRVDDVMNVSGHRVPTMEVESAVVDHKAVAAAELAKTRSGKIMRRLLRDIAEGRALGDTTTLADPNVVAQLKNKYEEQEYEAARTSAREHAPTCPERDRGFRPRSVQARSCPASVAA